MILAHLPLRSNRVFFERRKAMHSRSEFTPEPLLNYLVNLFAELCGAVVKAYIYSLSVDRTHHQKRGA
jgi:hypothetical protein